MVKEKAGHVDYVKRTKALYLNNQNICQAAKIDSIVIAEFRGIKHVQSNTRKNKNIAIFKIWAIKALRGDHQTQSRLEQSDLRQLWPLWEGSTDRPRLMRGQTEVCPWGWFKQHILTLDDLYDTSDGEAPAATTAIARTAARRGRPATAARGGQRRHLLPR